MARLRKSPNVPKPLDGGDAVATMGGRAEILQKGWLEAASAAHQLN